MIFYIALFALLSIPVIPFLVAAVWTVVGWFIYIPSMLRVFVTAPQKMTPVVARIAGGEDCKFTTADGIVLEGTYFLTKSEHRRGTLIYCHEYSGDRWNAVPYFEKLIDRGFDVLTFDFRNHGTSGSTEGYQALHWPTHYELLDVQAAIDYATKREESEAGVGLLGVSRGGSVALCAAAVDDRVRAVVTDGAFPIRGLFLHYMRRYMNIYASFAFLWNMLPDWWLASYGVWMRMIAGARNHCRYLNVERSARRVRQPVFLVRGQRDSFVPMEVAKKLRSRLGGRTKLWIVKKAKHNAAIEVAGDQYVRRLERFFAIHLDANPLVVSVQAPVSPAASLHKSPAPRRRVARPKRRKRELAQIEA